MIKKERLSFHISDRVFTHEHFSNEHEFFSSVQQKLSDMLQDNLEAGDLFEFNRLGNFMVDSIYREGSTPMAFLENFSYKKFCNKTLFLVDWSFGVQLRNVKQVLTNMFRDGASIKPRTYQVYSDYLPLLIKFMDELNNIYWLLIVPEIILSSTESEIKIDFALTKITEKY